MEIRTETEAIQKAASEELMTFWKRFGQRIPFADLFPRSTRSKYQRHQGKRECERRMRQQAGAERRKAAAEDSGHSREQRR